MKTIVLLIALGVSAQAQDGVWQPQRGILYTSNSPAKQARALKRLGLSKGAYTLVLVRPGCGDCDREAKKIADSPRTVVLVDGRESDARTWARQHNFRRARVVVGDEEVWGGLGGLYLPTFIRIEDGRITGARRTAP